MERGRGGRWGEGGLLPFRGNGLRVLKAVGEAAWEEAHSGSQDKVGRSGGTWEGEGAGAGRRGCSFRGAGLRVSLSGSCFRFLLCPDKEMLFSSPP